MVGVLHKYSGKPNRNANALPRGPLDCLSIFYNIGERRLGFQKHWVKSAFLETPETFVQMDVWLGGDKNAPFIFLKFEYSNKQNLLIPKAALIVLCGH